MSHQAPLGPPSVLLARVSLCLLRRGQHLQAQMVQGSVRVKALQCIDLPCDGKRPTERPERARKPEKTKGTEAQPAPSVPAVPSPTCSRGEPFGEPCPEPWRQEPALSIQASMCGGDLLGRTMYLEITSVKEHRISGGVGRNVLQTQ